MNYIFIAILTTIALLILFTIYVAIRQQKLLKKKPLIEGLNFVTLDFETANKNPNSICEVGITIVEKGKIKETKAWLVKPPNNSYDAFNVKIHGINSYKTEKEKTFDFVWNAHLLEIVAGKVIICHNASFDINLLLQTLKYYQLKCPYFAFGCSLLAAKNIYEADAYSLESLCRELELPLPKHRAGEDSRACAELVLKMFDDIALNDIKDFEARTETPLTLIDPQNPEIPKLYWNFSQKEKPKTNASENPNSTFYAKLVVFTGDLAKYSRSFLKQYITDVGGIPKENVTKATNFLVIGKQDPSKVSADGISTKHKKALEYIEKGIPIKILTEKEFYEIFDKERL